DPTSRRSSACGAPVHRPSGCAGVDGPKDSDRALAPQQPAHLFQNTNVSRGKLSIVELAGCRPAQGGDIDRARLGRTGKASGEVKDEQYSAFGVAVERHLDHIARRGFDAELL